MAGGRPLSDVGKHFDRNKAEKKVTCLKCQEVIDNAKVEKLERHILKICPLRTNNSGSGVSA
ncbi:hypothetical protein P3T76_007297 [Phytophthora citrophthora]|uniref:BED-type domain-containing protein n=1 Tax=Phytophthora citrophthora TaxID=4793 RepID=A0AAD9GP29_9STRA|nr:hypothetical protein P3T76_007297 [Phytophthora citrophthora]